MKVNVTEVEDFKPIKVEITIETKDELFELYHRANIGALSVVKAYFSPSSVPFPKNWMGPFPKNWRGPSRNTFFDALSKLCESFKEIN